MNRLKQIIKLFIPTYIILMIIDGLWLGFIVKEQHALWLGPLLRDPQYWSMSHYVAAFKAWAFLALGMLIFVLPRVRNVDIAKTFGIGALFGLLVYGVFQMTCYAIIVNWPWQLVYADMAWGTFLCGVMAMIIHKLDLKFR